MKFLDLKKEITSVEMVALAIFIIYLILPFKTPDNVSAFLNTPVGLLGTVVIIVFLFMFKHPALGILFLFVLYELFRRMETEPMSTAYTTQLQMNEYGNRPLSKESVSYSKNNVDHLEQGVVGGSSAPTAGHGQEFHLPSDINIPPIFEQQPDPEFPTELPLSEPIKIERNTERNTENDQIIKRINPDMSETTLEEEIVIGGKNNTYYDLNSNLSVNSKSEDTSNTYSNTILSMGNV